MSNHVKGHQASRICTLYKWNSPKISYWDVYVQKETDAPSLIVPLTPVSTLNEFTNLKKCFIGAESNYLKGIQRKAVFRVALTVRYCSITLKMILATVVPYNFISYSSSK